MVLWVSLVGRWSVVGGIQVTPLYAGHARSPRGLRPPAAGRWWRLGQKPADKGAEQGQVMAVCRERVAWRACIERVGKATGEREAAVSGTLAQERKRGVRVGKRDSARSSGLPSVTVRPKRNTSGSGREAAEPAHYVWH